MEGRLPEDLVEEHANLIGAEPGLGWPLGSGVTQIDIRQLRARLGLSREAFARDYHIPLATLKGWEQGRRRPDATVAAYLRVITLMPEEAREALGQHGRR